MTEHQEQVTFFDVLRSNEARYPFLKWVHAIPSGGHRHPAVAGKLKAEGARRGIADICLPFKGWDDIYPCAYIEMKVGRNKLTPEQTEFRDFIIEQGYAFRVCYSADEALDFVETYCGIKLTR